MVIAMNIFWVIVAGLVLFGGYKAVFGYDTEDKVGGIGLLVFIGVANYIGVPMYLFQTARWIGELISRH